MMWTIEDPKAMRGFEDAYFPRFAAGSRATAATAAQNAALWSLDLGK